MRSIAAIVLCAGKGTRMKSELPKVLHPVLGRPLCAYPIARSFEVGASPVVAVVGHRAELVEEQVRARFPGKNVLFALQREQKGTADAVRSAQEALSSHTGAVIILYGDGPLLSREAIELLVKEFETSKPRLAMVTTVFPDGGDYGRVVRNAQGGVQKVVEKKDCTPAELAIRECNMGIYIASSEFLWSALANVKSNNPKNEFYLTDLVEMASALGPVPGIVLPTEETSAVNDRVDLADCTLLMRKRINRKHMEAGVTFLDPATTYIEEGVEIGADTVLGPNVSLHAGTKIGRNNVIGQGCVLTGATLAEGVELKPYTVVESSTVAAECILGPFSRLRPGTVLAEKVHLGNFVETKNAKLGVGTKAGHLAYLGDATIGSGVNVGAGTITCNYDGVKKHHTVLGDNVFIGSDTQLVAPVSVGEGAYIGAGTTVTQDVPAKALAISRAPQVNKDGWVTRKQKAREQSAPSAEKSKVTRSG